MKEFFMKKENSMYMSSYNAEKFNEVLKFTKIENIVTKPWTVHPAIPLCVFILIFIIIAIDSSCSGIIVKEIENFINDGNELLLVICFAIFSLFMILGEFLINTFSKLKEEKYGKCISRIQKEIFSKILDGCNPKISLGKGLPEEIINHVEKNSQNGDSFYSYEGFLCFVYKDTLISRGLVVEHNFSINDKRRYRTWYVFKPKDESNFPFDLGNNFTGKDCVPIDNISSNKKFNIIGESDKIQKFLTKEKKEELSKLNKLMDCDFQIINKNGLIIMADYHGRIYPESLDIKYNDTIESYELKLLNEVEKMKAVVDFINN